MTKHGPRPDTRGNLDKAVGTCDKHGKFLYVSRKSARQTLKRLGGKGDMQAYPCDYVQGMWHVGHSAPPVRKGQVPRRVYYPREDTP